MGIEQIRCEITDAMATAEIRMMALDVLEQCQAALSDLGVAVSINRANGGQIYLSYVEPISVVDGGQFGECADVP